MKINNSKKFQNIAISIFADIDYDNFGRIYRECTRKPYSFLTINTTLPASDPLRFRKNLLPSYKNKNIKTDQIKILDRKIMQNEAKCHLDRKAAKISELSSKNLPKYEHLTGEHLGYEPSVLEQARFDYSPLGTFFSKRLKEKYFWKD